MLHGAFDRMRLSVFVLALYFTCQAHGSTTTVTTTQIGTTSTAPTTVNMTSDSNANTSTTLAAPTNTSDPSPVTVIVTSTPSATTVAPDSTSNSSGNSTSTQSVSSTVTSMGDNSSTTGVTPAVTSPETNQTMNASTTPETANSTASSSGNSTSTESVTTTPMGDNSTATGVTTGVTSPAANDTGANSTMPGANVTSTMPAGNGTSTGATTVSVAPTPSTTVSTTPPPQPYPAVEYNMNTALYQLTLNISDSGQITSACNDTQTKREVEDAFKIMNGYLYVVTKPMSRMTSVYVYFRAQTLVENSNSTHHATRDALMKLNSSDCLNVTSAYLEETSAAFAQLSMKICEAQGVCQVGYRCMSDGMGRCQHLCANETCSGRGTCYLNLTVSMGAITACSCGEQGMYYYGGQKCENQILKPDVIIAIIAGILGSVCFILFVILIVFCVLRARASNSKYEMNGRFNEGYTEHSLSKF